MIKVSILKNQYLNEDGTFNKEQAIILSGKIAGICYDKEGFSHLENEPLEKTMRRVDMTLNNGHHSVYDHVMINFNFQNIPKILAMILNNEHFYTTSEKSARYTKIEKKENSYITLEEEELYNKWLKIFEEIITLEYHETFSSSKIKKLAQENARYLVTVFMPTDMIYSTSLRQINYLSSWMQDYIMNANMEVEFEKKLSSSMQELINALKDLNVLEEKLMVNDKHRKLSLFATDIKEIKDYFGDVYSTTYKGSFAQLAQAQRHRTLDYKIEILKEKEYFIPPIISNRSDLVEEWLKDMNAVKDVTPQGELILINEVGKYDDFILKCKERICSCAQLEIMNQTRETLLKYKDSLKQNNHPKAKDIIKYTRGARCTFPDFKCNADCRFKEGKTLTRKI